MITIEQIHNYAIKLPLDTTVSCSFDNITDSVEIMNQSCDLFTVNVYNPYAVQPDSSIGGANFTTCQSYILLEDNYGGGCGPFESNIAGEGVKEDDEAINGVNVHIVGENGDEFNEVTYNGLFHLGFLDFGQDYVITPIVR